MGVERTFVIIDLAGFTAATEAHGDDAAADLAEWLVDTTVAKLGDEDELVKSLGDAVLCACLDPTAGVVFARSMFAPDDQHAGLPLLRVGLHHGTAARRNDDYFGAGVNVAARVADLAAGGQVLATDQVASAAADLAISTVSLGSYEMKNVERPVELFELELGSMAHGYTIDPVCQMRVARDAAAGRLRHEHVEYWFCSLDCVAAFAEQPERYAADG